jgi:CheY-like chemotaxis protein
MIHQITCTACSTKLSIPEEKLPKGLTHFVGKCPKCQNKIEVNLDRPAAAAPAGSAAPSPAAAAAPVPAPAPAPAASAPAAPAQPAAPMPQAEAPMHLEEEFVEGRRLAMACFDAGDQQAAAKAALEELGYTVHAPATMAEALQRLKRSKYEVILLHQEYGGSAEANAMLQALQPMPMVVRRHLCVGLVGKTLRTIDNMAAFALSVNFTVAEKELDDKLKSVVQHAVADNETFYRPFLEALREAGKA